MQKSLSYTLNLSLNWQSHHQQNEMQQISRMERQPELTLKDSTCLQCIRETASCQVDGAVATKRGLTDCRGKGGPRTWDTDLPQHLG